MWHGTIPKIITPNLETFVFISLSLIKCGQSCKNMFGHKDDALLAID